MNELFRLRNASNVTQEVLYENFLKKNGAVFSSIRGAQKIRR